MDTAPYSSADVCRLAGISYRQLDHWTRTGLIEPAVNTWGSGSPRRWSEDDVLAVRVVKILFGHRCERQAIRHALDFIGNAKDFLWVQGQVVGVGDVFDVMDALSYVKETVVVNLATLRADLVIPVAV